MKTCSTNVARSMGFLSAPSQEERTYNQQNVTVMGPMVGQMVSYHADGLSSKEIFLRQKAHRECVMKEFRL